MEFDIRKTVELVKGGLLEPEATWNGYLAETPAWQKTQPYSPSVHDEILIHQ